MNFNVKEGVIRTNEHHFAALTLLTSTNLSNEPCLLVFVCKNRIVTVGVRTLHVMDRIFTTLTNWELNKLQYKTIHTKMRQTCKPSWADFLIAMDYNRIDVILQKVRELFCLLTALKTQ